MDHAKLLFMTAVLTAVIWATADRLVNESVTVTANLRVLPPAGSDDVLVDLEEDRAEVQLQVAGPRRVIEELQANAPVDIRLRARERHAGTVALPLLDAINEQWLEFPKLTVVSVTPSVVTVDIDRRVAVEVPILLRPTSIACDVAPQPLQMTARLQIRESMLAGRGPEDLAPVDITADVQRLLRDQPVGRPITFPVPLSARAYGHDAAFEPAVVDVSATITAQQTTATVPTVPILLAVSFPNLGWKVRAVTRDDAGDRHRLLTRAIRVTGPTDAVEQLLRQETRAYGIVQLKEQDLQSPGTWMTVVPDFHLPPHVVLVEPPEPVEFVLERID